MRNNKSSLSGLTDAVVNTLEVFESGTFNLRLTEHLQLSFKV